MHTSSDLLVAIQFVLSQHAGEMYKALISKSLRLQTSSTAIRSTLARYASLWTNPCGRPAELRWYATPRSAMIVSNHSCAPLAKEAGASAAAGLPVACCIIGLVHHLSISNCILRWTDILIRSHSSLHASAKGATSIQT